MNSGRIKAPLISLIEMNPKETFIKGHLGKKIGMDKLQPFSRDVLEYEIAEFNGGSKFRNGDTIMARITPCLENGKTAMINILDENEVGFGSTEYIVFRAKEGYTTPDFVYYLISSSFVRDPAIKSMVGSSGRQRVQTDVLQALEISVPPLDEQKKIASILKGLDDKIALNNAINCNLAEQICALYTRLRKEKIWSICPIGQMAEKVAMGPFGSNIKVETFVDTGVPIISGNHLRSFLLEDSTYNFITEEHAAKLQNSIVFAKDIIFTHAGNIGQVAMIPDNCEYSKYVLSQRQFYLRCNTSLVLPEWVLMFFHSREGQHELLSFANQTGVPSIAQPASNLKKIEIPLPPIDAQREWLEIVIPMFSVIQQNKRTIQKLSSLRDTLLPKLMSGEIDVSKVEL